MAGINFGNTPYGSLANFRAKVAAQPKSNLPEIKGDGIKKQNDSSVKPNSAEPTVPQTGNGGLSTDQVDALKAKILAQPKPDLPPSKTDTDKRPEDAPKLPPAYEKRNNKPGFGGIA